MLRRALSLLTVLVAVLSTACMAEPQQEVAVEESAAATAPTEAAGEPTASAAPAETPAPTPELGLLDFSVPAVGGGQINGADLVGRDVLLWFWAPW